MWNPSWTDTVKIESGGRYPLLLNRFQDHLEQVIIKGIVSTTDKLRFISYYCWIIGDIENTIDCKSYDEFEEAFRRRENALAIGYYLLNLDEDNENSYTIYGRNTLNTIIEENRESYDCSFKLMKSSSLGAYQLYYKGTIFNWGLVYQEENGVVKLTQEGEKIYNIIEKYYTQSEYYKRYKGARIVPTEVLEDWALINDYNNITKEYCKNERDFYKNIIYRLDQSVSNDYRRDTFTFYLECIRQCSRNNTEFYENIVSNIAYFGKYYDNDSNIINFNLPKYFEEVSYIWSIYELQVYFRYWISEFFSYFLEVIKSKEEGMSIDDFLSTIDVDHFNDLIFNYTNIEFDYFNNKLDKLMDMIKISNIDSNIGEEQITISTQGIKSSEQLSELVLVIICLYRKYNTVKNDLLYLHIKNKLGEDYWFDNLFLEMDNIKDLSISKFLTYILKKYIIDKHDYRMYEKGDLRRCWFTKEKNNYIFQSDYDPENSRPAKFYNIMSFLYDMNLIIQEEDTIRLTEEGELFYKRMIGEYYDEK